MISSAVLFSGFGVIQFNLGFGFGLFAWFWVFVVVFAWFVCLVLGVA